MVHDCTSGGGRHRKPELSPLSRLIRTERFRRGLDQVINSSSSALFSVILILAATDAAQFGAISIQTVVLSLALGLLRTALFESVLLAEPAASSSESLSWILIPGAGVVAAVAAPLTLGIGIALLDESRSLAAGVAAVVAMTLLIDGVRYTAFALNEARFALALDATWLVALVVLASLMYLFDGVTVAGISAAYAVAGVVGVAIFTAPVAKRALSRERAALTEVSGKLRFGGDFLLQAVPAQAALVLVALVTSLAVIGDYRALIVIFQPLSTALFGVRLGYLGQDSLAEGHLTRTVSTIVLVTVGYTSLAIAAILLAPGSSRSLIASASIWGALAVGASEAARQLTQLVIDLWRVQGRYKQVVRCRIIQGVVLLAGSLILAPWLRQFGLAMARLLGYSSGAQFGALATRSGTTERPGT